LQDGVEPQCPQLSNAQQIDFCFCCLVARIHQCSVRSCLAQEVMTSEAYPYRARLWAASCCILSRPARLRRDLDGSANVGNIAKGAVNYAASSTNGVGFEKATSWCDSVLLSHARKLHLRSKPSTIGRGSAWRYG
jgi:hypothetical protein